MTRTGATHSQYFRFVLVESARYIVDENCSRIPQKKPCKSETLFVYERHFAHLFEKACGYARSHRAFFHSLVDFRLVKTAYFQRIGKVIVARAVFKKRKVVEES